MVWWLWLIGVAIVGAAAASGSRETNYPVPYRPRTDYCPRPTNYNFEKKEVHTHRNTYVQVSGGSNRLMAVASTAFRSVE